MNLNASVHSEYQQKSPHTAKKMQSPKSLHNAKVPLAIQTKAPSSNLNGSMASSSIFKNEHLAGSPQLSNRMREVTSRTSSSMYSNSLRGVARKMSKQSKLLPTNEPKPQENLKNKPPSNASKDQKKASKEEEKKVKADSLSMKQFASIKQAQALSTQSVTSSTQKKSAKTTQRILLDETAKTIQLSNKDT